MLETLSVIAKRGIRMDVNHTGNTLIPKLPKSIKEVQEFLDYMVVLNINGETVVAVTASTFIIVIFTCDTNLEPNTPRTCR